MITLAAANAAYSRLTALKAEAGDVETLIAAAKQGDMPAEIVELGNALERYEETRVAYKRNPNKIKAWSDALDVLVRLLCREG